MVRVGKKADIGFRDFSAKKYRSKRREEKKKKESIIADHVEWRGTKRSVIKRMWAYHTYPRDLKKKKTIASVRKKSRTRKNPKAKRESA